MQAPQTFYEIASNRLDEQFGRVDALDTKAASALAFSASVLPIFGAIIALSKQQRPTAANVLYVIAMVIYALLLLSIVLAYRVSNWSLRPDLPTLTANSQKYDEDTMRAWVGEECLRSVQANEARLEAKSSFTSAALGLLALDALLLSAAALLTIW